MTTRRTKYATNPCGNPDFGPTNSISGLTPWECAILMPSNLLFHNNNNMIGLHDFCRISPPFGKPHMSKTYERAVSSLCVFRSNNSYNTNVIGFNGCATPVASDATIAHAAAHVAAGHAAVRAAAHTAANAGAHAAAHAVSPEAAHAAAAAVATLAAAGNRNRNPLMPVTASLSTHNPLKQP